MSDADLEMAELHRIGACEAAARRHGVCFHNGTMGPMGAAQHGWVISADQRLCPDCGQIFPTTGAWLDAREEVMQEWT
jgi:hypothetical protein